MTRSPLDDARDYIARGWAPVPVPFRSKNPGVEGWQKLRLTPESVGQHFNGAPQNIGVLLGEPSGNLQDVDLDTPEAIAVAPHLLPPTGAIFGRAGAPDAHWLYVITDAARRTKNYNNPEISDDRKARIVELRGTGGHTIFPGSVHEDTGEAIEWSEPGEPGRIGYSALERACSRVAVAALLAEYWGHGTRDDLCTATVGVLLRAGFGDEDIGTMLRAIAEASDDEKIESRMEKITRLRGQLDIEGLVPGYPTLAELTSEKAAEAVRKWLGAAAQKPQQQPTPTERGDSIEVRPGTADQSVDEILGVLGRRGVAASIFVRGGMLVRPYLAPRLGFHKEQVVSLEMAPLDSAALTYELGALISFFRYDKNGRSKPIDCPVQFARTVLSIPHEWRDLPRLDAIVSAPLYLGNGQLLSTPGYHAERRVWLTAPAGITCPERPTRADAERALSRLKGWIDEFPFARGVDESSMLAGIMSAALRPSLSTCPGVVFDAPEFASGKTTAAKLVHLVGFGRVPAVMTFAADPHEMRKLIDAAQIEGRQSLTFDNVPTNIVVTHDALAQVLTERERQARELGASRTHIVPCNQLVIITGNNISVGEDLTRRLIACRLDPLGDPTARKFKRPDLLAEVQCARAAILTDVFTIVAAYEAAADPRDVEPLVGYEEWCRWVQRPLVWLGCEDPVLSVRELQSEDEDRACLERLVELWHAVFGGDWIGVKALSAWDPLRRDRESMTEMIELLKGVAGHDREGRLDSGKVGLWLRKNKDRWTRAGLRIERKPQGAGKRSGLWRVGTRTTEWRGSRGFEGVSSLLSTHVFGNSEKTGIAVMVKPPKTPSTPSDDEM